MSDQRPTNRGRLKTRHTTLPPVKIDFAATGLDLSGYTKGRLKTKHTTLEPIEIDFSQRPPVLVLTLTPDRTADPIELALSIFQLLAAINKLDIALGGGGYVKAGGRDAVNGSEVTIRLDPVKIDGASERMNKITESISRPQGKWTSIRMSVAA
jgi:hypothetical protein